jgi:hypothetical protein
MRNIPIMSIVTAISYCLSVASHCSVITSIGGRMVLTMNVMLIDNDALEVTAGGKSTARVANWSGTRGSG